MSEKKLTPAQKAAKTRAATKAKAEAAVSGGTPETNGAPGVFDPEESGADVAAAPQPTIQGFEVPEEEKPTKALSAAEVDELFPSQEEERAPEVAPPVMATNGKPLLLQRDMRFTLPEGASRVVKAGEALPEGLLSHDRIREHLRKGRLHTELPLHLRQQDAPRSLLR